MKSLRIMSIAYPIAMFVIILYALMTNANANNDFKGNTLSCNPGKHEEHMNTLRLLYDSQQTLEFSIGRFRVLMGELSTPESKELVQGVLDIFTVSRGENDKEIKRIRKDMRNCNLVSV